MARKKTKREVEESKTIDSKIDELILKYKNLFDTYDFVVTDKITEDVKKAIEIGGGLYIAFTEERIKDKLNQMLNDFVSETNEKLKKGENPFAKINVE